MAPVDLAPGMPSKDRRGIQNDNALHVTLEACVEVRMARRTDLLPLVSFLVRTGAHPVGDLALDGLENGSEEGLFVVAVMVEGATRDARALDDLFHGHPPESAVG